MENRKEIKSKMKMAMPIVQGLLASGKYIEKYDDDIYRVDRMSLVEESLQILAELENSVDLKIEKERK